jgi:cytochrome c553
MKLKLALILLCLTATAQAAPFASGKLEHGKQLHAQKCNACHAAKFNDDGSKIYLRSNRRVNSATHLAQQITACNSMLALDLFPEDETALGAFINRQFYKFK